jgi:hypothetical protein
MRPDCGGNVPKCAVQSSSVLLQALLRLTSIVNLELFLSTLSDNYFEIGLSGKQRKTTTSY